MRTGNHPSSADPVTGRMAVTLMDELRAIYGIMPAANRVIVPAVAIIGLSLVVWSAGFGSALGDIRWALGLFGAVLAAFTLFLPVFNTLYYLLTSAQQRQLTVVVDAEKIEKRSGTGLVIAAPWSDVRWCRESNLGFAFGLKPIGVMWLPKRAFATGAIRSIRTIARHRIGETARLREDSDER